MEEDLEEIRQIVAEAEEEFSTYLADVAYEALVLHIALSIERFRSGGCYEERFEKFGADMESIQYRMAWRIIGRLNQNFKIELPDSKVQCCHKRKKQWRYFTGVLLYPYDFTCGKENRL